MRKNNKEDRFGDFGLQGSTLEELGLDWEPESVVAQYEFQGVRRKAQNIHLIVNNETGKPIAAASADWKPLGNKEFFQRSKKAFDSINVKIERGGYIEGARQSLKGGDRCSFLISSNVPQLGYALFGDEKEVFHSRLVFYNHHHPGFGMGAKLHVVRLICKNGMVANEIIKSDVFSHTEKGVEKHKAAFSKLFGFEKVVKYMQLQQEALIEAKISDDDAIDFFIKKFGEKEKELHEQPTAVRTLTALYQGEYPSNTEGVDLNTNEYTTGTAYGLLQSVAAYYTHVKGYGSSDSKVRNQLFLTPIQKIENSLVRAFVPRSRQEYIQEQVHVFAR